MLNKKYFLKELCNYNIYENIVYISNKYTGDWFKIPREIFDLLVESQKEKINIEELYQFITSESDKSYFDEIVKRLEFIGLLHNSYEFKINRSQIPKIVISLTNYCNLNCDYCCVDSSKESQSYLSLEEIKDMLNKIVKFNPKKIVISGGEPMSRVDFFDILKYLTSIYSGKIQLATNATYINESNVELLAKYIHAFDISLDGYDEESCSSIRGKNVFYKVMESIKLIQDLGCKNISVSMVMGKNNESQVDKFNRFCKSLNVRPIVRGFTRMGRGDINASKYLNNINDIFYSNYKDKRSLSSFNMTSTGITCRAGESQLFVNYDGNIYPCPLLQEEKYIIFNMKNLEDKDIADILNCNYDVLEEVDKLRTVNYENCKNCKYALFCNNCLSIMDKMNLNESTFKHNCENMKQLFKLNENLLSTDGYHA